MAFLSSPAFSLVAGAALPLVLIFGVAVLKKLVRGPGGFHSADFYQGIELCWAALGVALLFYYDLVREFTAGQLALDQFSFRAIANTIFVVAALFVTLGVASVHQELDQSPNYRRQWVVLGVVCNLVGAALMVAFVTLVKGS